MKKLALVLTIFTASIYGVNAQIQFGVKAGANLSSMSVSPSSSGFNLSSKLGFNGGVLVGIPLFDKFSLQPEAIYSLEGAKIEVSGQKGKYNLSFINIPVLFKYKDASGFFAETGPQIGFPMSAKAKADQGGDSQDIKDAFKSTNFSWALGIGYQLPSLPLGIDVRYALGLANIAKNSGSDGSLKQSNFSFGLFYLFGGGKK